MKKGKIKYLVLIPLMIIIVLGVREVSERIKVRNVFDEIYYDECVTRFSISV